MTSWLTNPNPCLLLHAEPVFRRLRDDLLAGKIFEGMIWRGWKRATKAIRGKSSRKLRNFRGAGKTVRTIGQLQRRGWGGSDRHEDENENFQTQKTLSSNQLRIDLNIYIVGAGA